jgi:hypothetical protein
MDMGGHGWSAGGRAPPGRGHGRGANDQRFGLGVLPPHRSDTHANTHCHRHSDRSQYQHRHGDCHANSNTHRHTDPDCYIDRERHAQQRVHCNPDTHAKLLAHVHTDAN